VQKVSSLPGVKQAFLDLVCCTEDHKSMLYVGVEEPSSPCLVFNSAPTGSTRLPGEVVRAGNQFAEAWQKSVLVGNAAEDRSEGHSLSNYPELRAVELPFISFAQTDHDNLIDVLRNSSASEQRALAAEVLGYVKDKQDVVPDLVAANARSRQWRAQQCGSRLASVYLSGAKTTTAKDQSPDAAVRRAAELLHLDRPQQILRSPWRVD
jgi:hypothetical protein